MIDGYDDVHDNVRYWIGRLLDVANTHRDGRPCLVDVGANEGQVSLPYATVARIIAFEPQRSARERFEARASKIPEGDATMVPVALGASNETASMYCFDDDTFSTFHARSAEERDRYHLSSTRTQTVAVTTLDDIVAVADWVPDVVKIDVEGAERDVLRGARRTLTTHQPAIVTEYSCINAANAGYDRSEIVAELEACGYTSFGGLFRNENRWLHGPREFDDCRIWNVIAFPAWTRPAFAGEWQAASG